MKIEKYFNHAVRYLFFPIFLLCWAVFKLGYVVEDFGSSTHRVAEWCKDKYVPFFDKHFPID